MKAAAQVYEDFVASFQDTGKQQKTWVKGGTVNPGAGSKFVIYNLVERLSSLLNNLPHSTVYFGFFFKFSKK